MSKRYGRNQKRKARAEIARLEAVASMHHRDKMQEQRQRAILETELVEWAHRIVALLGHDSAFARELESVGITAADFDLHVDKAVPMRVEAHPHHPTFRGAVDLAVRVLDTFAVYAFGHENHLSLHKLFEVVGPDGRRALMMDQRTLHSLRQHGDHGLIRYLVEGLVQPWMKAQP